MAAPAVAGGGKEAGPEERRAGGGKAAGSEERRAGGCCVPPAACGTVPVVCVLLCLGLAGLQVWHLWRTAELRAELQQQQRRLTQLEHDLTGQLFMTAGRGRQRRSVSPAVQETSPDGIPIVNRPYGHRPGLHENRPGMRVYDTFGTPTEEPDSRTILPHHRSSAAFHGGQLGRVNTDPESAPAPAPAGGDLPAAAAIHHRRSRVKQAVSEASKKARRGRRRRLSRKRAHVKRLEAKRMNAKRMKMRGIKVREEAEARGAPTDFATGPPGAFSDAGPSSDHHRADWLGGSSGHRPSGGSSRYPAPGESRQPGAGQRAAAAASGGHHRRSRRLMRMVEELRQELATTAAHFEGHTTGYSLNHPHYNGNGILRNAQPNAMFVDWQFAEWVHRLGYSTDFHLHNGRVTVKKPGVYYLYAQINYQDPGDINGFELTVSGRSFAKCLTMESTDHRQKVNTCHTSGVTYLDIGDKVSIRDIEGMHVSMFLPDRSFFGLVRLAGTGGGGGGRRLGRSQLAAGPAE